MKDQKRERPAVREDREPFDGAFLCQENTDKDKAKSIDQQELIDVDDWRKRIQQAADDFLRSKGRRPKWGRR